MTERPSRVVIHFARVLLRFVLVGSAAAARAEEPVYWQVVFSYEDARLAVLDASRLPPMKKRLQTTEEESSPLVVGCELSWLDAGGATIRSCPIVLPLGMWYDDFEAGTGGITIPDRGCVTVRIPGPASEGEPTSIRLKRTHVAWNDTHLKSKGLPDAFRFAELLLPIEKRLPKIAVEPGPVGITKIHDSGDDGNRIVVAILGDGYTEEDLSSGLFADNAETVLEALRNAPPWSYYMNVVNVYRIDTISKESGVDDPANGFYADTYFDSYIDGALMLIDSPKVHLTIFKFLPPPSPESILVLGNTPIYSGAGSRDIATTYNGEHLPFIALHEQGHQFGFLIDEYETGADAPPEHQSDRLNWDRTYDRNRLKWKHWVEPDTPLPTPETVEYDDVVGAFEGANRWPIGVYRPYLECMMRSFTPFCPVCQELVSIKIIVPVDLADAISPEPWGTVLLDSALTVFEATPVSVSPLVFEWELDGEILPGETGPTLSLSEDILGRADTAELWLTISHPTDLIRKRSVFRKYPWTLQRNLSASVDNWRLLE